MKIIFANNITWIDIQKPKQKDLDELKEKFHLHPFIAQQFLPPIHRPKIEEHPNQLFIVLHFPIFKRKSGQTKTVELDFIVTPTTLITSHLDKIPDLEIFFNDCQIQEYHQNQHFKSSGHLLFGLLDWLIDACLPMLDQIGQKIEKVEAQVFKGKEKEMLFKIALLKRDLIDFRRATKPQRSVLEILEKKSSRLFSQEIKPLAQEVIGSSIRVWNVLENHRELIISIEQTNNSLLSHKLSDIMKFLTVVSFITFPLSVIVGFFGMNVFDNIPLIRRSPFVWLVILIFMFITASIMVIYFKKKKWL
ncbi:MAG: magnesium transporter CorA family protein [Candidatus Portnoybacteria bacterium]|nr:magnesium transporter CorA family protein [Candidatus Portnoybacteria bacterium]